MLNIQDSNFNKNEKLDNILNKTKKKYIKTYAPTSKKTLYILARHFRKRNQEICFQTLNKLKCFSNDIK
jgi:hypothetical protein